MLSSCLPHTTSRTFFIYNPSTSWGLGSGDTLSYCIIDAYFDKHQAPFDGCNMPSSAEGCTLVEFAEGGFSFGLRPGCRIKKQNITRVNPIQVWWIEGEKAISRTTARARLAGYAIPPSGYIDCYFGGGCYVPWVESDAIALQVEVTARRGLGMNKFRYLLEVASATSSTLP